MSPRVIATGWGAPDGAWSVEAKVPAPHPLLITTDERLSVEQARAFASSIVAACDWIEAQA